MLNRCSALLQSVQHQPRLWRREEGPVSGSARVDFTNVPLAIRPCRTLPLTDYSRIEICQGYDGFLHVFSTTGAVEPFHPTYLDLNFAYRPTTSILSYRLSSASFQIHISIVLVLCQAFL